MGSQVEVYDGEVRKFSSADELWSIRSPEPVALQLLDALIARGIDTVFGIPGGAISPLYAALLQRPAVRVVNAKHETSAVFLAMGYAIATGRPGVVITTAGPGVTNALTGLASAYYEGVPILHLAGEVPTTAFGRAALQETSPLALDAVALVRGMTKMAATLTRPDAALGVLWKALAISESPRPGPVFLSLPLDVASAVTPRTTLAGRLDTRFEPDGAACAQAFALLTRAERPLILAGAGARDKRSRALLIRLAEATGAPVAVSPKGKGVFPEDHPLYLGLSGFGGHESLSEYLEAGIDVLLVCGSGLNDFATNAWSPLLAASRAVVQIDVDPAQLGKNYPVDLGLIGPLHMILELMLSGRADQPAHRAVGSLPRRLRLLPAPQSSSGALTTIDVALMMNELCAPRSVFTADMGEHLSLALHYLEIRAEGDFLTCLGFGSMGSSLGTAIGHQLGDHTRRVYAICGDGGFLMYGSELVTAVHHAIPVTILIMNDSKLNMCELGMRDLYGASTDMATPAVDFAAGARAAGAVGHVVRTPAELAEALRLTPAGPLVLDVRIDPEVRIKGSQRNATLRQFSDHRPSPTETVEFPDPVSRTLLLTAAARAAETERADRLFDDPHAALLAGAAGRAFLAQVGAETAVPSIAIRTRYYDEQIRAAIGRGTRQLVLVGAGLDSRAYRLGLPLEVRWFEVDRAPVLAHKRRLLAAEKPTVTLFDVPGDVVDPGTFAALAEAGLYAAAPTLWVLEGLLAFLPADEIDQLLGRILANSVPGSELLFDVPNLAAATAMGAFAQAGTALLKHGLKFGTDNPSAMVARDGVAVTILHEDHPLAHYGRRQSPPRPTINPGDWALYYIHCRKLA